MHLTRRSLVVGVASLAAAPASAFVETVQLPELVPGPRPNGTVIAVQPIEPHADGRPRWEETMRLDDGRVIVQIAVGPRIQIGARVYWWPD
jgi:hypothetical protein